VGAGLFSQAGQLAAQHTNVSSRPRRRPVSRILYTSMLNADEPASPLAGEHRDTEQALSEARVPFTVLRNASGSG
jgi:NAD(P)H dehydrogenase (quinone)